MSGYEGITCSTENTSDLPESEFTEKLSRGKLSFPPNDLYDLSQYMYSFFKLRKKKGCTKIYLEAFQEIYQFTTCDYSNSNSICRRFVNCFLRHSQRKRTTRSKLQRTKKQSSVVGWMVMCKRGFLSFVSILWSYNGTLKLSSLIQSFRLFFPLSNVTIFSFFQRCLTWKLQHVIPPLYLTRYVSWRR